MPHYKFELEEWLKLESKIEISKYPIRKFIYTTAYLLKNSKSVTELCIKTKEEFRLFMELNRLYSEISIETEDNNIENESNIKAFNIDNMKIIVDAESIMSVLGDNVIRISKDEFLRHMKINNKSKVAMNIFY